MSDDRVTISTTKQVNLAQLDDELGGYGLNGAEGIVQACEGSPVTEPELSAAIVAHVYVDPDAERLAASAAAVGHARSLGFTDQMIAVMYPNLVTGAEPLVVGRESLNIPAKIDNNVTLDTVNP